MKNKLNTLYEKEIYHFSYLLYIFIETLVCVLIILIVIIILL